MKNNKKTIVNKKKVCKKKATLSFEELRLANLSRCEKHFHKIDSWSNTDWACALAGEVGELCNFIKKMRRGQEVPIIKLAKEIGDIQCYLDLLAARLGIDLAEATINKFNEVSRRKKCSINL